MPYDTLPLQVSMLFLQAAVEYLSHFLSPGRWWLGLIFTAGLEVCSHLFLGVVRREKKTVNYKISVKYLRVNIVQVKKISLLLQKQAKLTSTEVC